MFLLKEFTASKSSTLDAAPDAVFALITDVDRLPDWNAHIHHVIERPAGPLAPGIEWVVQMRAMGGKWASRATCTEYDADKRVLAHVSHTEDGNPSSATWRWEVTPADDGRSALDVSWQVNPRTFWRRALFGKIRRSQLGDELPASFQAMQSLLAVRV